VSPEHDHELQDGSGAPYGLVVRGTHERNAFQLALYGELDIATSPMLEGRLQMAEGSDSERLVIDLRGLEFLDSAGLHVLVQAHERVRAQGRELALLRGPHAVQRVFALTHADRLFNFED
jgi:anti-sigma B factor antagonist